MDHPLGQPKIINVSIRIQIRICEEEDDEENQKKEGGGTSRVMHGVPLTADPTRQPTLPDS